MKIGSFTSNFKVMKAENSWGRIVIAMCLGVICLQSVVILNQQPVVTLVPPHLTEEVTLHHNKAQAGLHQAWSLYLAESLGNATPGTSGFIRQTMEPLLSPQIRDQVLVILDKQIDVIKRDQVSFSFEPREVLFDDKTFTAYVIGRHYTHTVAGDNPERQNRTYEFRWQFKNHAPSLIHIDTYEGAPRLK